MQARRGFGSDNHSGAHPDVLSAVAAANVGHVAAYGDDAYTAASIEILRGHFGRDSDIYFVFGGTGANVVGLASVLEPYEAAVCSETAHIMTDECGAPERVAGVKLLPVAGQDGKLTVEKVRPLLRGFGSEHHAQPRAISVSNVSELGTVYRAEELGALADLAHEHGMLLHVDGARLANAAAALGVPLRAITADAGVDLLSLGGTKNGMLFGEAVVYFGDARPNDVLYVRKQLTQLPSKCRFVAAQFTAMYSGDLWLRCASHANAMAARLAQGARALGVSITRPTDANEVFALLPAEHIGSLQASYAFYVWDEAPGGDRGAPEVRWVTSWDTTDDDVDGFLELLRETLG